MGQCFSSASPSLPVSPTVPIDHRSEIVLPAGARVLVQSVASSTARYQQYVQQISDTNDAFDAITSVQRGWMSAVIDAQKNSLDLCNSLLASEEWVSFMRRMLDDGAKYVLSNWQIDS